jgi:hypothetical protein
MADSEDGIGAITLTYTMEEFNEATQAKCTNREKRGSWCSSQYASSRLRGTPRSLEVKRYNGNRGVGIEHREQSHLGKTSWRKCRGVAITPQMWCTSYTKPPQHLSR